MKGAAERIAAADIQLRAVTHADSDGLIALWALVFPEYADPNKPHRDARSNIERKLAFNDGLFWLLEQTDNHSIANKDHSSVNNLIVGSLMAGYDGHRGWLYSFAVHPAYRGRGLGRLLLTHAQAVLRDLGCPKINLQARKTNNTALNFWRSVGYDEDELISFSTLLKPPSAPPANAND